MKTQKTLTIRLPEEVLEAMRELANEHTRSLNGEVLVALREYIQQQRQGLKRQSPYPIAGSQGHPAG
jgi:hypothetical protein